MRAGSPFLSNKRVFAFPLRGIPMGIKCDTNGYVYAGCADGLEIWSPGGTLQAVVEVPGETFLFMTSFWITIFTSGLPRLRRRDQFLLR